jgi:hypothetical protein
MVGNEEMSFLIFDNIFASSSPCQTWMKNQSSKARTTLSAMPQARKQAKQQSQCEARRL